MNESSKSPGIWLFIASSILLSSIAQLLFRKGMMHIDLNGSAVLSAQWFINLASVNAISASYVGIGLVAYLASLVCWLLVLSRTQLSYAYPMLSLSYVFVYFGAVYWTGLNETPSATKLCGIVLIIVGVTAIAFGGVGNNKDRAGDSDDQRI